MGLRVVKNDRENLERILGEWVLLEVMM